MLPTDVVSFLDCWKCCHLSLIYHCGVDAYKLSTKVLCLFLNNKGKQLEDFLSQEGLCIFSDGTDTYLHPGNGSYSAIDLTVTDPSLLLDFSWKVHDDLCGSDHFPIILESLHSTVGERPTRYKFDKADWPRYKQMYRENLQTEMIRNFIIFAFDFLYHIPNLIHRCMAI
jgi:hypothetical protein